MKRRVPSMLVLLALPVLGGCRQDMHDQPRHEPLEKSTFFADGRASRPQVKGTVARGQLELDAVLLTGLVDGQPVAEFPVSVDRELIERGRERFEIFCSVCHDSAGNGNGMIVKRGLKRPASFHEERLREAPPGYFYDVITRGYGVMYDYSDRIPPRDRWAIVAYIRALQLSQNATLEDVPPDERARLEAGL